MKDEYSRAQLNKEGFDEDYGESKEEGKEEGKEEKQIEIARNMKAHGALTVEEIASITGLSFDLVMVL